MNVKVTVCRVCTSYISKKERILINFSFRKPLFSDFRNLNLCLQVLKNHNFDRKYIVQYLKEALFSRIFGLVYTNIEFLTKAK